MFERRSWRAGRYLLATLALAAGGCGCSSTSHEPSDGGTGADADASVADASAADAESPPTDAGPVPDTGPAHTCDRDADCPDDMFCSYEDGESICVNDCASGCPEGFHCVDRGRCYSDEAQEVKTLPVDRLRLGSIAAAKGPEGEIGVLFGSRAPDGRDTAEVRFVRLSFAGELIGDVVPVDTWSATAAETHAFELQWTGDGWLAVAVLKGGDVACPAELCLTRLYRLAPDGPVVDSDDLIRGGIKPAAAWDGETLHVLLDDLAEGEVVHATVGADGAVTSTSPLPLPDGREGPPRWTFALGATPDDRLVWAIAEAGGAVLQRYDASFGPLGAVAAVDGDPEAVPRAASIAATDDAWIASWMTMTSDHDGSWLHVATGDRETGDFADERLLFVASNNASDTDIDATSSEATLVHNAIGELEDEPHYVGLWELDGSGTPLDDVRRLRPLRPVRPLSPRVLRDPEGDYVVLYAGRGELFFVRAPSRR